MLIVDWNLEYAQLTQDALEDNHVFRSSLVRGVGQKCTFIRSAVVSHV